jgi:hypothetical protein
MIKLLDKDLEQRERKAFSLHLGYSAIDGMMRGALIMNEFVFIKSLKGSSYQLGVLFQFTVIVLIFSVIFNELLRRSRNKKRFLRIVAVVTHFPLMLLLLFPRDSVGIAEAELIHLAFLFIFLLYFLSRPLVFPTINLLLKHNYRHHKFGSLYGIATSLNKTMMLVTTFVYGVYLDYDHYAFVYVFPVLAILGVFSIILLSKIDYKEDGEKIFKLSFFDSVKQSFRNLWQILKQNKPYRDYEMSFMLYGFAFMSTKAVITLFYKEELDLNYSSVAFYENGFNILAIILLPVFGKILGKTDPRRFVTFTYTALALFILFTGLTEFLPYYTEVWEVQIYYTLLLAVIFKGIFAATMALSWSIGSSYFCSREEAGNYQSVHLTLTGMRGLFAPLIGIWFYEIFRFAGTFGIAILFLLGAIGLMIWSYRNKTRPYSENKR